MPVPKLNNDCFAMPPGVDWTPVRTALDQLRGGLSAVVGQEKVPLDKATGRILAGPLEAPRAHPPFANSAVDGYGFGKDASGEAGLRLLAGRAAAGDAFDGTVGPDEAVRVLTGARIPNGVSTVVLDEDSQVSDGILQFGKGLKTGANTRPAGEDIEKGSQLLDMGRRLTPGDLAMLASVGIGTVPVLERLRVGVLSTGTEIVPAGQEAGDSQIFDANKPMLLSILAAWGCIPVDLGHVADDRNAVVAALDRGADETHAIMTTGGASAGDEDHISAALGQKGALNTWRIALKPGRPLALGLWNGVPVFGLPGNPVAAFVCTLVFARPALSVLGGGNWREPTGFILPAGFEKAKKPGRTEFLRARWRDTVEVFASEGSGRVSGLSWAEGLVALDHDQGPIAKGNPVRFIPFSDFGL